MSIQKKLLKVFLMLSLTSYAQTWSPIGSGTNGNIRALEKHNNKLYVGGSFSTVGSISSNNIASWDGLIWDSLGSGVRSNGTVGCLHSTINGLYVGGAFNAVGNIQSSSGGGIALWNNSNWNWIGGGVVSFSPYIPGSVNSISSYNNQLYIGGSFLTAGGSTIPNIAKWDGANWSSLTTASFDPSIYSMIVYNGELYVGGNFSNTGTTSATNIAKWNGSSWSTVGTGTNNSVNCFAIYNGELYVGGNFTIVANATPITANYIAKWDGTNWSTVGTGMDARVSALAVYNGELYAGGNFTIAGGVSANHIAKWNGTNWSPLSSGINGSIGAMKEFNGDLYVGGSFTTAGGVSANNIAKWNNPIGIKDLEINNEISIYPNPATNVLYLQSSQLPFNKEDVPIILDLNGKQIFIPIQHINSNTYKLDASTLTAGMYFITVKTEKGVVRKKLVIEK
jgi:hypothetical protein